MKQCGKIYHDGHISVASETKSEVSLLFKIHFARFIRQTKFRGNGLSNSSEVWGTTKMKCYYNIVLAKNSSNILMTCHNARDERNEYLLGFRAEGRQPTYLQG